MMAKAVTLYIAFADLLSAALLGHTRFRVADRAILVVKKALEVLRKPSIDSQAYGVI